MADKQIKHSTDPQKEDSNLEELDKELENLDLSDPDIKRDLKRLKKIIFSVEQAMDAAKDLMEKILERKDYRQIPGVEGVYDGYVITSSNGEKHEVPENYAAKSRLVYGDTLKIIEEDGKKIFKQIAKSPRKNIEGVVSKKEGKWHVLTEKGSHLISQRAVEFNNLQLNDLIDVIIPENAPSAPFATFNKLIKKANEPVQVQAPIVKPVSRAVVREAPRNITTTTSTSRPPVSRPKAPIARVATPNVRSSTPTRVFKDGAKPLNVKTVPRSVKESTEGPTTATNSDSSSLDLDDLR